MADRPVLRRRGAPAPSTPAPASVPVKAKVKLAKPVVEEFEDEEDVEFEDEDNEEEEEVVVPVKKAKPAPQPEPEPVKKSKRVPVVEEEEEEEPVPVKKAKPAPQPEPVKKAKPAPVVEEEEEEPVPVKKMKIRPVEMTAAAQILLDLTAAVLTDGKSVSITLTGEGKWLFAAEEQRVAKAVGNGLRGRAYWAEVLDPAYRVWDDEWSNLTQDERIKKAKKAGATWVEDKDPRVSMMRCTEAYRETMGIEKYKPEYRTRASRAALRG